MGPPPLSGSLNGESRLYFTRSVGRAAASSSLFYSYIDISSFIQLLTSLTERRSFRVECHSSSTHRSVTTRRWGGAWAPIRPERGASEPGAAFLRSRVLAA